MLEMLLDFKSDILFNPNDLCCHWSYTNNCMVFCSDRLKTQYNRRHFYHRTCVIDSSHCYGYLEVLLLLVYLLSVELWKSSTLIHINIIDPSWLSFARNSIMREMRGKWKEISVSAFWSELKDWFSLISFPEHYLDIIDEEIRWQEAGTPAHTFHLSLLKEYSNTSKFLSQRRRWKIRRQRGIEKKHETLIKQILQVLPNKENFLTINEGKIVSDRAKGIMIIGIDRNYLAIINYYWR